MGSVSPTTRDDFTRSIRLIIPYQQLSKMVPGQNTVMKSAGFAAICCGVAAAGIGTAAEISNYIICTVLLFVGVLLFVYPVPGSGPKCSTSQQQHNAPDGGDPARSIRLIIPIQQLYKMVPERKTLMKSAGLAAAAAGVGTAVGNSNYIIGIVLLLVGVLFFVYPVPAPKPITPQPQPVIVDPTPGRDSPDTTPSEPGNTKFESYGLGKGINVYQLSPWSSRSTQCRKVDFPKNLTDNTEDRQYDLTTVVESESSLHGKLSMGANIPEAFTKVNVAFDLTRDRTNSKKVNIKCRTKAKYYFKEDEDGESVFEQMLKQFRNEKESEYGEEWCKEFLKKHDNITHYVSSITLGAMQCTVLKEFTRKDEFGVSVEVELPKIGELGAGGGTTEQTSLSQQETKIVGTFTDDKTAVASPEVIHYECKPLFTLVSDPELKTALADQVKIETPNRIFCVIHTKTKLEITKFYWSLDNNGCLYLTEDKNTAALFYLRFTSPAEPPYFCITHVPPAQTSAPEQPVKVANPVVANPDESLNTAKANSHQNAERYISISTSWSHALPFGMGNDEVKLSAKMHANPAEVVFEFRNRVNPKAPVCISEMDILLLQQSNYMCIKPKRTGEFLTGCYDGTMCKLHLVSINKAESKSKPYFPLFGMESS